MNLRDIYLNAIDTGISNDPRGRDAVLRELKLKEKEFNGLNPKEKELFDQETLKNPYSDSRILNGTGQEEIASVLVGIDIEVGEILLAESLNRLGNKVDLIIAHHPEGGAYANLSSVMYMQSDILNRYGVPINIAEDLMEGRAKEVDRRLMPVNHTRAVDAARLLGIPFMCLHTPADNMVVTYLQRLFDESKPYTLGDIIDLLLDIPEYRNAAKHGAGPKIIKGSKARRAGKIFVDMTGGTEGAKDIFKSLSVSGINTIVGMHIGEEHRKEAEKNHVNVVIAGHISSDNLGVNLLLDSVFSASPVKIYECSGFKRVKRTAE